MACNLTYDLIITGDCSNTNNGAFEVQIFGSAPDYTIQWLNPVSFGTIVLGVGVTGYTVTNLSASTYSFNIIDSCSPTNTVVSVNTYISSGTCVSVSSFENTLCGLDNGSINAITSNLYGQSSFYLYDSVDGYITSATSVTANYQFTNLSASTYYVVANDGGGCTGQSESVIIQDSTTVDYGLYVVNDAGCAVNSGKIFVTGLTGNPPYTYLWSNGATTSSISGLTTGGYSVMVTDNTGCSISKTTFVAQVPPIGIAAIFTTGPSCFESNGEVTVVITGGTGPYYYSGSTSSNNGPSFGTEYTFTNLGSGNFNIKITDAGLCNTTASTYLTTPGSFSVVSITTTNSTCSDNDGTLVINLFGGSAPFIYTLDKEGGSTISQTTTSSTWSFNNLSSGTYTLTISDGSSCVYVNTYIINNIPSFILSATTTGTTCSGDNGAVLINVSGGTPSFTYILDGGATIQTTLSSTTFNNLSSGTHSVNVTDGSNCSQTITFYVNPSTNVDFILTTTDSIGSNNGTITALITSGEPPFILTWSSNVNGQTGMSVNSLSAGTYTLKVVDSQNCEKIRTVTINGNISVTSYQVYNVCDSDLSNYGELLTKGPKQMLLEGFNELTLNEFNCVLNQSIFDASITVSGVTTTQEFYTGTTLNEYPTVNEWNDVIESMLLNYDGISSVTFNIDDNKMTITTDCNSEVSLNDADVVINMVIYYDISCEACTGCYTPEFIPINCEITNEYCETTDTKLISPIQYNLFGPDYLDNTEIIPSRCTELPNFYIGDCDGSNDVESEFRDSLNEFLYYQNQYNLALSEGRVTLADSYPTPLPPSRYTTDYFYNGPDNIGWYKFNILQGCSCKKIFADDGHVGPEYDFEVEFLTEVQSYLDLPLTGVFGQYCFVLNDDIFYIWDPNTNNWVSEGTVIAGYPDADFCLMTQRTQRNMFSVSLDALTLAWRPFTWSTFHAPLYQIFKYKF
jgi:hypothetical protein